jgi:hypothetical protein
MTRYFNLVEKGIVQSIIHKWEAFTNFGNTEVQILKDSNIWSKKKGFKHW